MFHVKLLLLTLLVLIGTGCADVSGPEGWADPVEKNDTVILQLKRGVLSGGALNSSGRFLESWRFPYKQDDKNFDGFYATPVIEGNTAFIADHSGQVGSIDITTGRLNWTDMRDVGSKIISEPIIHNGRLYVTTENGNILVINKDNGALIDSFEQVEGRVWASPVIFGNVIYLASLDTKKIVGINLSNGTIDSEITLSGGVASSLSTATGKLIAGTLGGRLSSFTATNSLDKDWELSLDGWIIAKPLLSSGTLYVVTTRGIIAAINPTNGEMLWKSTHEGLNFSTTPIVSNGVIVVICRKGNIFGLEQGTGNILWKRKIEDAKFLPRPLLINNQAIILSHSGEIIHINPQTGNVSNRYKRED